MNVKVLSRILFLSVLPYLLIPDLARAADDSDSVAFAPDGTTVIRNVSVPLPPAISDQAKAMIKARNEMGDPTHGLTAPVAQIREMLDPFRKQIAAELLKRFPSKVETKELGGVTVHVVTPQKIAPGAEKSMLINVHAGAFMFNQGSITEAIPIAALTGITVIAVDYRLAPENPFPAAVDDTVAVYREVLKTYAPDRVGIYGSSSGSVLSVQAVLKARQVGLPVPGAIGFFSGTADFARAGDSEAMLGFLGFSKQVAPVAVQGKGYIGNTDPKNPLLSPLYGDLKGLPPTLCMTGTRDFFLSGTSNFHRALLKEGIEAELVVFDGMPHIHWDDPSLPESEEAWKLQAGFLAKHVLKL
ncbi:alpha/beta hydrolase [Pseudomonas syringae]|uniref:alpha/beta hydrolase n=1 Tax=Pseudomonas syringae TaxID=317 RepID=UPI003F760FE1